MKSLLLFFIQKEETTVCKKKLLCCFEWICLKPFLFLQIDPSSKRWGNKKWHDLKRDCAPCTFIALALGSETTTKIARFIDKKSQNVYKSLLSSYQW